jgi:hypothetical protein
MARGKKHTAEQVVSLLRQVGVGVANGKSMAQACKEAEIVEQTYYRWRQGVRWSLSGSQERAKLVDLRDTLRAARSSIQPCVWPSMCSTARFIAQRVNRGSCNKTVENSCGEVATVWPSIEPLLNYKCWRMCSSSSRSGGQ